MVASVALVLLLVASAVAAWTHEAYLRKESFLVEAPSLHAVVQRAQRLSNSLRAPLENNREGIKEESPDAEAETEAETDAEDEVDARSSLDRTRDNLVHYAAAVERGIQRIHAMDAQRHRLHDAHDLQLARAVDVQPMPTDDAAETVTLLWSGGTASTYRLCEHLRRGRTVRPVFVKAMTPASAAATGHNARAAQVQNAQETQTIRTLVRHLREEHPDLARRLLHVQTIRNDRDMLGGIDVIGPTHAETNATIRAQLQQLLDIMHPGHVPALYVTLARLRERQNVPDTFLASGHVEWVLTEGSSHDALCRVVRKEGVRVTPPWLDSLPVAEEEDGARTAAPAPPPSRHVVYATRSHSHTDRPTDGPTDRSAPSAANLLHALFPHIHFVLRHPHDSTLLAIAARDEGVADVVERAWSCSSPSLTDEGARRLRLQQLTVPWRSAAQLRRGDMLGPPTTLRVPTLESPPLAWQPCMQCRACRQRRKNDLPRYGEVGRSEESESSEITQLSS